MQCDKTGKILPFLMRAAATMLAGAVFLLPANGQAKHFAPAKPAAKPATTASHTATTPHTTAGASHGTTTGRPGASAGAGPRFIILMDRQRHGLHPAGRSPELPTARVTSMRTASGHEVRYGANGHVREIRSNGMTIRRGPGGMRHTIVDRPDHSRMVAYGHGRGYIQRPYAYRGHTYYSRAYYYHPCYYHGVYRHGYMPAPAPVPAAPAHRGPVTIALGQTPDQVVAMKGQPLNKVVLGRRRSMSTRI